MRNELFSVLTGIVKVKFVWFLSSKQLVSAFNEMMDGELSIIFSEAWKC
jgi:hypothetical protein